MLFAIAGSHASGTMEYDQSGGEVKRVHNGMACSGECDPPCSPQWALPDRRLYSRAKRGILKVFSGTCNTAPITEGLGSDSAVLHAAIKRFPVNASQHSPIELLDDLLKKHKFSPE